MSTQVCHVQIEKVMESQRSERDADGYASTDEGIDALTQAASLQAQMDAAVESEDFALAATIRDKISKLKAPSLLHTDPIQHLPPCPRCKPSRPQHLRLIQLSCTGPATMAMSL